MTGPVPTIARTIRPIARGGFGIVEEVELADGRRLARKTFDPHPSIAHDGDLCEKARQRFIREVSVQALLDHPHIVPVIYAALGDEPPWFLMPLARMSLEDQINDDRANAIVTLEPLVQMLAGLEELHRLGFVHRDLKPHNVLNVEGRWMLSDLGLVLPPSATTTTLTGTKSAWGTAAYAAPDVILGFHTVTDAADIFSVGCILHDYVGTTARVPYSQCTSPGPLGGIIEKCTAPKAHDRFANVGALRTALVMRLSAPVAAPAGAQTEAWVELLKSSPDAIPEETWHDIARFIDINFAEMDAQALLYAIDTQHVDRCIVRAPSAFPRLAAVISRWAKECSFDFPYCDVLGARLAGLFQYGGTREKADAVLAALHLGYSHNRWSVMRLFFRLAGPSLPQDVAERLSIEFLAMGHHSLDMIERLEYVIRASRATLHPILQEALERIRTDAA